MPIFVPDEVVTAAKLNLLNPSVGRWQRSSAQSIPNNAATTVAFNSEVELTDPAGRFSFAAGVITIEAGGDGWYHIAAGVEWATNGTGNRIAQLRKNGTGQAEDRTATTGVTVHSVGTIVNLVEGDQIDVAVVQSSGGSLNVQNVANTHLAIAYLGEI